MSKATYVGINDDLDNIQARKVKNVWTKEGGVLRQKVIPKGFVGGSLKEFMQYGYIYFNIFSANNLYKLDSEGNNMLWQKNLVAQGNICVDSNGYVYSGYRTTLYKFDENGNQVWSTIPDTSNNIQFVAVDNIGNVYTFHATGYLVATDKNGVFKWSVRATGTTPYSLAVDNNGYVYVGDYWGYIKKFNISDGAQVWSKVPYDQNLYSIATSSSGYIYLGYSGYGYVYKLDSNGGTVWSQKQSQFNSQIQAIAIDEHENIYGTNKAGDVYKWDKNKNIIWEKRPSEMPINSISINPSGDIFVGYGDGYIRKLDSLGNQVIAIQPTTYGIRSLAVYPLFGAFPSEW